MEPADRRTEPTEALLKLSLLPLWLRSATFRYGFTSGVSANKVCFERELLDHFRLVFERQPLEIEETQGRLASAG